MTVKKLLTDEPFRAAGGEHNIKMIMGTGTGKLQLQVADEAYVDVPDSSVSASDSYTIDIPACRIKAVLTGDAACYITRI